MVGAKPAKRAITPAVAPDFNGKWANELGSTMELTVRGARVTGSYTSAVSDDGTPTPPHPLVGEVHGELISFIVNWTDFGSITAWVGHMVLVDGAEQIFTLWQMTKDTQDPEDPTELWESINSGNDTFHRP
jgi:Avidin family